MNYISNTVVLLTDLYLNVFRLYLNIQICSLQRLDLGLGSGPVFYSICSFSDLLASALPSICPLLPIKSI